MSEIPPLPATVSGMALALGALGLPSDTRESKFELLAAELLGEIFDFLDTEDISNVRMTCRIFANACIRYLPKKCGVSCAKTSLERIEHISSHQLISQRIRSLTVDCSQFWTLVHGRPNQSWDYVPAVDPEEFPWCEAYKKLWKEQKSIKQDGKDIDIISRAIPHFKNLKSVRICMGCFNEDGRLHRETYNSALGHFSSAHDKPVSCSIRQYLMVMEPLRDAGIKIESLELLDISYGIFYPVTQIIAGMQAIFEHLTNLSIRVQVHPDKVMSSAEGKPELGRVLSWGILARYLEAATRLRSLSLSSKDDHGGRMMSSDNAFPEDMIWEHLHTLTFDNVWIAENILVGLATRHGKTLKNLNLHNIILCGSWFTALPAIREGTSLEKAVVYGWIANPVGEYSRREHWRVGVYPDRVFDTPWGDDGREHTLGLQVASYLCKEPGAVALPLDYSNMTRHF
ncbi:hypothetical protein MGYG_02054 [Nannizzia gypsea CBS 118893]|uniref:F-box domain-containing protein n=1 Tax=Arthroderma gypseum (strain ATCC MYA-4604 / CBS 118893) TaxID=535722 RepID=E4UPF3_ARTGP|nr:hypothetical protein MGYG_02054 [Nannizzia gypsea CBS 118893]EFQ99042.1 hypothetical protein MGYG_02054 [Nannizzia gypsea CBS 118893]